MGKVFRQDSTVLGMGPSRQVMEWAGIKDMMREHRLWWLGHIISERLGGRDQDHFGVELGVDGTRVGSS